MKRTISIIGMGCSGVLILRSLAKVIMPGKHIDVLIFNDSSVIGTGIPYSPAYNDDLFFLMNMKSSLLSTNPENEMEFDDWLKNNIDPSEYIDTYPYVRRTIFGNYLQDAMQNALNMLTKKSIRIQIINQSVINIIQNNATLYTLKTQHADFKTNYLILATGHLKKKSKFIGDDRYIANPYHNIQRILAIKKNKTIGILGTKLTAVDFAILLGKLMFKKIHLFSKSGLISETQSLASLQLAIQMQKPVDYSLSTFISNLKDAVRSAKFNIDCNDQETMKAIFQKTLDSSKYFIDEYWQKIDFTEKIRFICKYKGIWMSYRHPMPPCNSSIIKSLMSSDILLCHKLTTPSVRSQNDKFIINTLKGDIVVDYLIDACMMHNDINQVDSNFISNLIHSKFISSNNFGGININKDTMQIDKHYSAYAIGALTQGIIFYVNAIERLVLHAGIIANHIVENIR